MILGLDTSSRICTVALASADGIMAEFSLGQERAHSRWLVPGLAYLLDSAGVEGSELGGIAVTSGPGSFTGLRIGVTTAKLLGYAWQLPVVPLNTLEVLVRGLVTGALVSPMLVARRGEVYAGLYQDNQCLLPPRVVAEEAWVQYLQEQDQDILVVGDALERGELSHRSGLPGRLRPAPFSHSYPRAAVVAELGLERLAAGGGVDPLELRAEYLKRAQAEITWEKQQGRGERR